MCFRAAYLAYCVTISHSDFAYRVGLAVSANVRIAWVVVVFRLLGHNYPL